MAAKKKTTKETKAPVLECTCKVDFQCGVCVEALKQMGLLSTQSRCECKDDEPCTCGKRVLTNFKQYFLKLQKGLYSSSNYKMKPQLEW